MPTTAEDILGWSETYAQAVDAGCRTGWSHAYLIESEHAQGAAFYARALARSINCEGLTPEPAKARVPGAKKTKGKARAAEPVVEAASASAPSPARVQRPCGVCEPCRRSGVGSFPPLVEIWPVGVAITIDQVHEIISQVSTRVSPLHTKVFILHAAEQMQTPAASALLKTLEEPPPHTVFVLATASTREILPTIRSRCRLIRLGLPHDDDLWPRLGLDVTVHKTLHLGLQVAGRHPDALMELTEQPAQLSAWTPPADFAALTELVKKAFRSASKDPAGLTSAHSVLWSGWYGLNLLSVLSRTLVDLVERARGSGAPAARYAALIASRNLADLHDLFLKEAEKSAAARLAAMAEQFGDAYVHPQLGGAKVSHAMGRLHSSLVLRALTVAFRQSSQQAILGAASEITACVFPVLDVHTISRLLRHLDLMRSYIRQNVNVGQVFDELFLGTVMAATTADTFDVSVGDGQAAEAEVM